jgi:hypothetical protein
MLARGPPAAGGATVPGTFTQFLLHHDYASLAELEEASQATVLYGGRLGSSLIELGILAPEQLDAALARFHGLPEIPREWLARPDPGARAALHLDLIKRVRAFPLHFEKRSLHVGLVDPRNEEVLDDLAFASGCLVVPYALAEFRFVELLRRIYGSAPSARFRTLLDEGRRARAMRQRDEQRQRAADPRGAELEPLAAPEDLAASEPEVRAVPPLPAARESSAESAPLHATAETPAPAPAQHDPLEIDPAPIVLDRRAAQPTLEELEAALADATDRAQVIELSLALASRFAEVAALFVVREGVATGLAARRSGYTLDVDATLIPLTDDGILARCAASRALERTLASSPVDKRLARALHSDEGTELAALPVTIGERVVNLLLAQPSQGRLSSAAVAALASLAPQIGGAYERLIRVQKQRAQALPSPGDTPKPKPPAARLPKGAIGALALERRVVKVPAKD